jgi:hypothetical protein
MKIKDGSSESDEMPVPPDLSSLFKEQTQQISEAIQKAQKSFETIKKRDQDVATLTETLTAEINEIFVIAAAAQTPQLAAASIPVVLALANAAFATVPISDQKALAEINEAFAPFKSF